MKTVYLISGKKRSGKDTAGKQLRFLKPTVRITSFAMPIKKIVSTMFDIPSSILEEYKNNNYMMMHGIPNQEAVSDEKFQLQSYRKLLQKLGSEAIKPIFGYNVWADLAVTEIKKLFKITDDVLITDFRFPEEAEVIKKNFKNVKTILIYNSDTMIVDPHISENALNDFKFDYEIRNDGSIDELKEKLKEVISNG